MSVTVGLIILGVAAFIALAVLLVRLHAHVVRNPPDRTGRPEQPPTTVRAKRPSPRAMSVRTIGRK